MLARYGNSSTTPSASTATVPAALSTTVSSGPIGLRGPFTRRPNAASAATR